MRLRNIVDILHGWAQEKPDAVALRFLGDAGAADAIFTFASLDQAARNVAAALAEVARPADRVALLYGPGPEFIPAFLGCLYAGVTAVPISVPRFSRKRAAGLERMLGVLTDAAPVVGLTTSALLARFTAVNAPPLQGLRYIATDGANTVAPHGWIDRVSGKDGLALIQYTSGSTSDPKGVMVSHSNLIANQEAIRKAFHHGSDERVVSWLPLHHDMGLIGALLQPLYLGGVSTLLTPSAFLTRPLRWLEEIARWGATTSGGPNFAYDLCVRSVAGQQLPAFDLSSWRVAFNGAEPIHRETLKRFADTFRPLGFRRQAFFPCYGLAEATLFVAGGFDQAADAGSVCCGTHADDHELVIVNPDTLVRCTPGEVGEICVAGPSVSAGYWNRPTETASTFIDGGTGTLLRTGDLGFMGPHGLYVSGRRKDIIIIRGVNHHPHDIERTVAGVDERLIPDGSAAFSIERDSEERLVVVQEIDRRASDFTLLPRQVASAIAQMHGIELDVFVMIRKGTSLKTSSGKIRRAATRRAFLEGTLEVVGVWRHVAASAAATSPVSTTVAVSPFEIEIWLRTRIARMVGLQPHEILPEENYATYGLDSLASTLIVADLEQWLGRTIPETITWDYPSIRLLAEYLGREATCRAN